MSTSKPLRCSVPSGFDGCDCVFCDLFRRWKAARPKYQEFSNDGIILDDKWEKQHPKITFLLKETNDGFHEVRGRGPYIPKDGNSHQFWRNMNIWSHAVSEWFNGRVPIYEEAYACKEAPVDSVAYVNIKKYAEDRSISDPADIQEYADKDWSFIEEQLCLVDPHVIVCGGTYKFVGKHFNAQSVGDRLYRWRGRWVIDFLHPSSRVGYEESFGDLRKIVGGLSSNKHQ